MICVVLKLMGPPEIKIQVSHSQTDFTQFIKHSFGGISVSTPHPWPELTYLTCFSEVPLKIVFLNTTRHGCRCSVRHVTLAVIFDSRLLVWEMWIIWQQGVTEALTGTYIPQIYASVTSRPIKLTSDLRIRTFNYNIKRGTVEMWTPRRHVACVIAQQYSSATFISFRFHSRKKIFG
jgi:hypothetical protein